jgi:hypothetical protein
MGARLSIVLSHGHQYIGTEPARDEADSPVLIESIGRHLNARVQSTVTASCRGHSLSV